MNWLTDELLFFGGTVLAAAALMAEAVCLLVFRLRMQHIQVQMDLEYGIPAEKKPEE